MKTFIITYYMILPMTLSFPSAWYHTSLLHRWHFPHQTQWTSGDCSPHIRKTSAHQMMRNKPDWNSGAFYPREISRTPVVWCGACWYIPSKVKNNLLHLVPYNQERMWCWVSLFGFGSNMSSDGHVTLTHLCKSLKSWQCWVTSKIRKGTTTGWGCFELASQENPSGI